jgi:multidrug efflux pump subunit AcrA (membrane-fusion protein)
MKKVTLIIFCAFASVVVFFVLFGGMIRRGSYVPVTTAKVTMNYDDFRPRRVVPNEAVYEDMFGGSYVWVLYDADDIGEPYFYAGKVSVEILDRDDMYAYVRSASVMQNLQEDMLVIVTAKSELQDRTKVKITEGGN